MARIPYTPHPSKHSASHCCTCGQGRGETRQVLIGRDGSGSIWLCVECSRRDVNRQTFLATYVALMAHRPLGWDGESVEAVRAEE